VEEVVNVVKELVTTLYHNTVANLVKVQPNKLKAVTTKSAQLTEDGQHGVLTEFAIRTVGTEHKLVHVRALLPYHCTVVKIVLVKQQVQEGASKLNVQSTANGLRGVLIQDVPKHVQVDRKHVQEHVLTHHHDTMDKHVLVQPHKP